MPSMSYCMFGNTASEMNQVLDKTSACRNIEELDLNEYEQVAFRMMYEQCQEYIIRYRDLAAELIKE